MHASRSRTSLSFAPILPPALRKWAELIEPALHRLLIPDRIVHALESVRQSSVAVEFARRLLDFLDIRLDVQEADLLRVPANGPIVAVANHPFGIVEGLVLLALLGRVRPDSKILANSLLGAIAELRASLILVNPFETREAHRQNLAPLREACRWLSGGGLLAVFPGGEVASLNWMEHSVTDPHWKTTAARLASRAHCPVLPVFFMGANSVPFQLAGALHPALRTLSLVHEFQKLSGKTVRVRIGNPIPPSVLARYRDAKHATAYLRSRTFFLANRSGPTSVPPPSHLTTRVRAVALPAAKRLLSEEVAALPADCELAVNKDFAVYLTAARAIPRLLDEIGRCREVAFCEAGEGTGCDTDLDRFDRYYQHLFLWSKTDSRVAGAYRLAVTTDVLPQFGSTGLYTSTLFRFHRQFFERIGPAVELGRSFVMPEYQKNYSSLLLLWKGIVRAVQRRPEAPVLFGAVSISNRYQAASRGLMVNYLSVRASHELARFVQPRRPFRHPAMRDGQIRRFATVAADIEDVSLSIADIEDDAKGVPVLLRQYLKAGGRLLGFNLDPSFSDVLDALIVADLRTAPVALLERCMGYVEARAFMGVGGAGGSACVPEIICSPAVSE
ncbi:MAG TPA: GNAT family N-acyltransferase [Bryobacteraceae bacterium]|jgi:putative hemolysin|nr:GNAT family N-acyltransferase [Bryobacteraceae bacterium]